MAKDTVDCILDIQSRQQGSIIVFTALLQDITEAVTSQQSKNPRTPYTSLLFRDESATIKVNLWDKPYSEVENILCLDSVYTLECVVGIYGGKRVINTVISLEPTPMTEESEKRFFPHYYRALTQENVEYFNTCIRRMRNANLRRYVEVAYGLGNVPDGLMESPYRERYSKLLKSFGSINYHDCYPGGLMNHYAGGLRILENLRKQYSDTVIGRKEKTSTLDWDFITCVWLLHDIGKDETYEHISEYRVRYKEGHLSHEITGVNIVYMIHTEVETLNQLSTAEFQHLLTVILNHSNLTEFFRTGDVEGQVVALIDAMDTAMVGTLKL